MEDNGYIKELLTKFAAASEDTVAFSLYDGQKITNISYRQFACDVLHAAGYFVQNNIRNKHIALIAPNNYKWIVTFFAIVVSGNVAVLLNPALPNDMLQIQCKKA